MCHVLSCGDAVAWHFTLHKKRKLRKGGGWQWRESAHRMEVYSVLSSGCESSKDSSVVRCERNYGMSCREVKLEHKMQRPETCIEQMEGWNADTFIFRLQWNNKTGRKKNIQKRRSSSMSGLLASASSRSAPTR